MMSENADKIVGGVPAKIIRPRFEQPVIDALLSLRWWDWPEEKVKRNVEAITSGNVRKLLEESGNK
ncbi:hypothetical protein [Lacrimispora defluvii]|uniref:Uncharacterized protein n=1 Tax=Lacrimispora defluvii TaxID=2719233 RepID=A0ABX1VNR1_9FIRM|nr:hypothetical protein [Lacrimispora defluvii]NNJ29709.1 hypothetical protein [Lacrimispora defluvii]